MDYLPYALPNSITLLSLALGLYSMQLSFEARLNPNEAQGLY